MKNSKLVKSVITSRKSMANKDYSNLDKDELLKIIGRLESRKKYGLIWDEEKVKERFEEESENALPILKEIKSKEIVDEDKNKPSNILIEGDNYHALSVLNFTHRGKIDLIYIDPPYNTGSSDWKYNNDYVEKDDTYRHSKWLSFMSKRLRLAKLLLKEEGSLICAIDDNEQPQLGLLLQEIFPAHEVHCITIIHNPGGVQGKNFSYSHEYAYFVIPSRKEPVIALQDREDNPDIRPLRDVSTGNHLRENAANCFYPIYVKDEKIIGFGNVCPDDFHPKSVNILRKDGILEIYPIDPQGHERKWVFARQTVESIRNELTIEYNRQRKIWDVIRKKTQFNYKTVWDDKKFNANIFGTKLLSQIVKIRFPFPKSLYAVEECIRAIDHPKNAIILDFFAGSGTTAHAVLELNKKDSGERTFIIATNNENRICEEVCYPRVKNVIKGYKNLLTEEKVEGFGGNLRYFKTGFVKNSLAKDDLKIRLTKECTEMLCLREGIFDEIAHTSDYKIFQQGDKILAVYYSLERMGLADLKKKLDKLDGHKTLYCFTLDPLGLSKNDFTGWDDVDLEPIPQKILDVYKQIYEY